MNWLYCDEKKISFGDEGLEYLLESVNEFLQFDDVAWPYMKDRVKDYLSTLTQ